ncbi:TatD family hydrolase [Bacillus sp. DTU_2020_1000418_1_SI_GHA_SEK_038]|uniref:TatD family hydrolase n=1 Tax=Bacillus sp. DTU_2020_1000418_1_SI_GHA_SEK_038 TaxID=3077585 RepID=UPI0028EB13F5|nr:TatD family hydrolase [Bacillus sp. DTU_2020_1000418_1_SI_GHA_SEK_038]WNS76533.1 TatD family hydrolase [Bacillus sp. DTU_2020_1000418_1_SI_GHA_SEK_038]
MMKKIIDSHIHLDQYEKKDLSRIIEGDNSVEAMIAVSFDLQSCKATQEIATCYQQVYPAYGYHPEQKLPHEKELVELINWMDRYQDEMIAVGEVGLPYYLRQEQDLPLEPFLELLEEVTIKSKIWQKPLVLHAVYEDAKIVCDLLEKHSISKAHFHWFKGDEYTIDRMIKNGYFISVTPDVLYEDDIQGLVKKYPLEQIMVETDGPWPFEGPFTGCQTHPQMMHKSLEEIARLKRVPISEVYSIVRKNTIGFYCLRDKES